MCGAVQPTQGQRHILHGGMSTERLL